MVWASTRSTSDRCLVSLSYGTDINPTTYSSKRDRSTLNSKSIFCSNSISRTFNSFKGIPPILAKSLFFILESSMYLAAVVMQTVISLA